MMTIATMAARVERDPRAYSTEMMTMIATMAARVERDPREDITEMMMMTVTMAARVERDQSKAIMEMMMMTAIMVEKDPRQDTEERELRKIMWATNTINMKSTLTEENKQKCFNINNVHNQFRW